MREGQKIKRRKTGECKSDITALTYAARPLPQFVTGQSRSRRHAYTPPYIYIYTYYPFVSLHDALFLFPPNGSLYFYTYIYSTCALSMGEKVAADGPDRWSAQRSFHDTVRTQASGRRSISLRRHLFSFASFQGHPNRQDSLELWVKRGLIATRAVAMAYKTLCELKTNDFEPSCLPTFNCNMSIPHYRVWKKGSIGSEK